MVTDSAVVVRHPKGLPAELSQLPRTLVVGVLNVTPDSFSDGGQFLEISDALAQANLLLAQGADIIDIGGESTRPGAARVPADQEQQRVLGQQQVLAPQQVLLLFCRTRPRPKHTKRSVKNVCS